MLTARSDFIVDLSGPTKNYQQVIRTSIVVPHESCPANQKQKNIPQRLLRRRGPLSARPHTSSASETMIVRTDTVFSQIKGFNVKDGQIMQSVSQLLIEIAIK